MASDIQIYCDCMARIRDRINVVQTIMSPGITIWPSDLAAELISLQFRKTLEEIAFSSLSANKKKYSEIHANFSRHWRATNQCIAAAEVMLSNGHKAPNGRRP